MSVPAVRLPAPEPDDEVPESRGVSRAAHWLGDGPPPPLDLDTTTIRRSTASTAARWLGVGSSERRSSDGAFPAVPEGDFRHSGDGVAKDAPANGVSASPSMIGALGLCKLDDMVVARPSSEESHQRSADSAQEQRPASPGPPPELAPECLLTLDEPMGDIDSPTRADSTISPSWNSAAWCSPMVPEMDTCPRSTSKRSNSLRLVAEIITQGYEEDQDELRGVSLQAPTVPTDVKSRDFLEVANATKQFPAHWFHGLHHYVVPLIASLTPTLAASWITHAQLRLVEDYQGEAYYIRQAPGMPVSGSCLSMVPSALAQMGFWGTILSWLCILWDIDAMRPAIRWVVPAFACSMLCGSFYYVVSVYLGLHNNIRDIIFALYLLQFLGWSAIILTRAGSASLNPSFKVFLLPLFGAYCYAVLARFAMKVVLSGPDPLKAVFVVVVNPLLCETAMIMPARFVARALFHNHPSTSFITVVMFVFAKQWVGRSMVALIDSPAWVVGVSISNFFIEILMRVSLTWRDRVCYEFFFSRWLPPGVSAHSMLTHHKNKSLRAHIAAAETIGDVVAIWNGVAVVILFDVSVDGRSPMDAWKAIHAGLVQTFFEFMRDYLSVIGLSFQGIREIDLIHGRYLSWSLAFACSVLFISAFGGDVFLAHALCYQSDFTEATFVACGGENR